MITGTKPLDQTMLQTLCRPMTDSDLPAVLALQAQVYPADILEEEAFFLNRLALAAWTCRVTIREERLLGYLVAYPWSADLPPALNQPLERLPQQADSWFVHDCAVSPQAQGLGLASLMLRDSALSAGQAGLTRASLVSLAPAVGYWEKQGYRPVPHTPALVAKLAGYGPGASYMTRELDGSGQ